MHMSLGGYIIYIALLLIIPLWAQSKVKNTYKKYSKIATSSYITGAEVARKILDDNGLYDVKIERVKGVLYEHYDPRQKVDQLSEGHHRSLTKAPTANDAHAVVHEKQDPQSYAYLRFRSALVPVASLGSNMPFYIILAGFLFGMLNLVL